MREGPIKPILKGSRRNMLSRSLANAVINVCNLLLTAEGKGLKITATEGRLLFEVDADVIEGSGAISFQGEWIDEAYSEDDVVIRSNVAAINDGRVAGTYIAIQDVPQGTAAPGTAGAVAHWALFAKGFWNKLLIWQAADDITTIEGGSVESNRELKIGDGTGTGYRVTMTKAQLEAIGAPANCAEVYLQRIETCEQGTPSYRVGLLSNPWPQ